MKTMEERNTANEERKAKYEQSKAERKAKYAERKAKYEQSRADIKAKGEARRDKIDASNPDLQIVCPHCNTTGHVSTKHVKVKGGISGGKATGALLTGGLSLLATGLSRKQKVTEARCKNCKSKWMF